MPKNFADLTSTQQKFLKKYLRSGGVFKDTREKNEAFNSDFDAAVSPLFKQINRIEQTITQMAATDETFSEEINRTRLTGHQEALNQRIKDSAKMLKQREIPDFADIATNLQSLEDMLARRQQQGVDRRDAAAELQGEKEAHAEEVLLALEDHGVVAARVFAEARALKLLPDDVRAREAAIAIYETTLLAARTDISGLVDSQAADPGVKPNDFEANCATVTAAFEQAANVQITVIEDIIGKPAPTLDDIQAQLSEKYGETDTVKVEAARMAGIAAEAQKVEAALVAKNAELDALAAKMATASPAEQKRMRGEKAALLALINQISMRDAQLTAFQEAQPERERVLLLVAGEAEEAEKRAQALADGEAADWLDVHLAHLLEGAVYGHRTDYDAPSELFSLSEITEKIDATRVMLVAASERDVIIPRLTADEPRMKELSASELTTLEKMLDEAMNFANAGRTDLAFALHEEVRILRQKFTSARNILKLPAPAPPPPSPAQKLLDQLTVILGELGDLWGQGVDDAQTIITDAKTLVAAVQASEKTHAFVDTPELHAAEVDTLRRRMEALDPPPAETAALAEAKTKANENAARVDEWLDVFMKTKKITDSDIIEEPGKTYSKSERKKLIRRDEILTVSDGNGGFEKHRLVMERKGKGGEDHAQHTGKTAKKIPMEVLQALHTRSETLRMMAESGTPGSEEAIARYSTETEELMEEIGNQGLTLFPEIAAILKDCDKIIEKGTMAEFLPDNLGEAKNRYQAFKDSYLSERPSVAKTKAQAFKVEIDALEVAAEAVRTEYNTQRTVYGKIIKDLKGAKGKSPDAIAVGRLMEEMLQSDPDTLFAGSSDGADDATNKKLVRARKQFAALKEFYTANAKIFSSREMTGPWLNKTETAYKKLSSKVGTNVNDAKDELAAIKAEMLAFYTKMKNIKTATGSDLADKLIELFETLKESAVTAYNDHEARRLYLVKNRELKDAIKEQQRLVGKKGKNAIAQQLASDLDALATRRKGTKSKSDADEDYSSAMRDFEEIERELETLTEKVTEAASGKRVKPKNIKITDKLPVLENFLERMKTTATGLAETTIRPKLDTDDAKTEYNPKIDIIKADLARVSSVYDVGPLKRLATDIDADNASETPDKQKRVTWREAALSEVRKLRTALEMDPATQIYAKNPFDLGTDLSLVRTALHQVEVAVLVSVDPKEQA
ncbi:Massive surface protein MspF [Sulfitobacter noctilucae]|uniref:hypothetical protein n=1 Tax=Sulfitobacter noctilucae TaxID=1342302 RepID=UPI000469BCE2|nr:hypothetical protein [Sulfitobacter noctilucae]KIN65585.1 Massive surface protein MspF [Sulfitobacter noctilucae]